MNKYYVKKYQDFDQILINLFLDCGPLTTNQILKKIQINPNLNERSLWGCLYNSKNFDKDFKTYKWYLRNHKSIWYQYKKDL